MNAHAFAPLPFEALVLLPSENARFFLLHEDKGEKRSAIGCWRAPTVGRGHRRSNVHETSGRDFFTTDDDADDAMHLFLLLKIFFSYSTSILSYFFISLTPPRIVITEY